MMERLHSNDSFSLLILCLIVSRCPGAPCEVQIWASERIGRCRVERRRIIRLRFTGGTGPVYGIREIGYPACADDLMRENTPLERGVASNLTRYGSALDRGGRLALAVLGACTLIGCVARWSDGRE